MQDYMRPDQMIWRRDGFTITANEDGVHASMNRGLEQPEVQQFVDLWTKIRDEYADDRPFQKPVPPSHDTHGSFGSGINYAAKRAKAAAAAGIDAEFGTDTNPAF